MIISHQFRFIFIKTTKTAGTSLEIFLAEQGGPRDVVTPIEPPVPPHRPRHFEGWWNPLPELIDGVTDPRQTFRELLARRKYYNHMPARLVRARAGAPAWNKYFKFCVERNPWDKTLSHYHMLRSRAGGDLSFDQYLAQGRLPVNFGKYTDGAGRLLVDEVLRYENLNEELARVCARLGLPFSGSLDPGAKSEMRTDRRPYREVYTDAQREIVARAFAREIAFFGYTF